MRLILIVLATLLLSSCNEECKAPPQEIQPTKRIERTISDTELACLTKAIYHEARGEELDGQVAVGHVVLNRVNSKRYPSTICGVVHQAKQFTDIEHCKPKFGSKEWKFAKEVAMLVYTNQIGDPTKGAMWYFAQHKVKPPKWAAKKRVTVVIDNHTFLTNKPS